MRPIGMAGVVLALGVGATLCAPAATAETAPAAAPAPTKIEPTVPNAATVSIPYGADSALVAALKKGGYILFFRHAMTNWNERDTQEGDFTDRSRQRNLSEAGKVEAAEIGRAIAALKIPIERVLASPMWRTRDTAQLAFGAYDTTGSLFWKGPSFRETRIKMLSTRPAHGKNLVLVGHQDQLIPIVSGLRRDQLKEGEALVFEPMREGKYRVIAQVSPADWARLAGTPYTPPPPAQGAMPAVPPGPAGATTEPKTHN
jgi:phosphohistidine phosphatase SixA